MWVFLCDAFAYFSPAKAVWMYSARVTRGFCWLLVVLASGLMTDEIILRKLATHI
jgi:hypothetical protein